MKLERAGLRALLLKHASAVLDCIVVQCACGGYLLENFCLGVPQFDRCPVDVGAAVQYEAVRLIAGKLF